MNHCIITIVIIIMRKVYCMKRTVNINLAPAASVAVRRRRQTAAFITLLSN